MTAGNTEPDPPQWDTVREAYDELVDLMGPTFRDEFLLRKTAIAAVMFQLYCDGYEDGCDDTRWEGTW